MSNWHVVVAMMMAPVLSIVGWWTVGQFTGEKPQPAQPGQSYPLVEKSNCRYASGACDVENAEFKLVLKYVEDASGGYLVVRSSHVLERMFMSVGPVESELPPGRMTAVEGDNTEWRIALDSRPDLPARIRLVAHASGSTYFGDTGTDFLQPRSERLLQP